jgi:hypothetical protein
MTLEAASPLAHWLNREGHAGVLRISFLELGDLIVGEVHDVICHPKP